MLKSLKKWLLPSKKPNLLPQAPTDSDVAYARAVVDRVFLPVLQQELDILNVHLQAKGIRAGIDINWFFDKIEVQHK